MALDATIVENIIEIRSVRQIVFVAVTPMNESCQVRFVKLIPQAELMQCPEDNGVRDLILRNLSRQLVGPTPLARFDCLGIGKGLSEFVPSLQVIDSVKLH